MLDQQFNQQQALMAAIFQPGNEKERAESDFQFEGRGLAIYQKNLLASATGALQISFPTVLQLIGEDVFEYATQQLLSTSPLSHGDWGLWGEDFANVLSNIEVLQTYPFVSDSARLDFSLHELARQCDQTVKLDSFNLLADWPLEKLQLVLNTHLVIINFDYPVVDVYRLHENAQEQNPDHSLRSLVQQKLQDGTGQKALLYRPQYKAQVRELDEAEYYWLTLIQLGVSMGTAMDAMASKGFTDFSLETWLAMAIQDKLITRLKSA